MSLIPEEFKAQFENLHGQVEDINLIFYDLALAKESLEFEAARSKLHGQIMGFYSDWEKFHRLLIRVPR